MLQLNPGEPNTFFSFMKKLNCVYNGYYGLTKHKNTTTKMCLGETNFY